MRSASLNLDPATARQSPAPIEEDGTVRLDGRWLIPAAAIEDKLGVQLGASIAVDAPPSCWWPRVVECRTA
jgi:hypothetical protein